jgi:hypothetical protein
MKNFARVMIGLAIWLRVSVIVGSLAILGAAGCQKPASVASAVRDGRIVGKWQETGHGAMIEMSPDGTGTAKDKAGVSVSFSWATEGEGIIVSGLSAPSSVWPPKEGRYLYLYHASEQIRGAADLKVSTEDGKTDWVMDRP